MLVKGVEGGDGWQRDSSVSHCGTGRARRGWLGSRLTGEPEELKGFAQGSLCPGGPAGPRAHLWVLELCSFHCFFQPFTSGPPVPSCLSVLVTK